MLGVLGKAADAGGWAADTAHKITQVRPCASSLQALKSWQFVLLLIWAGLNTLCERVFRNSLRSWSDSDKMEDKPYRGEILSFPFQ